MKKHFYILTFIVMLISQTPVHAQVWSELGGLNSLAANNTIFSVCVDKVGNRYAAGGFTNASTNSYVAKWNGSTWTELGGLNSLAANEKIETTCSDSSGNIYAAGLFTNGALATSGSQYVAKYNGTAWTELGGTNALGANGAIYSICTDKNGNIYAAGAFTNASGKYYVAKYNGTSWTELGGLNSLGVTQTIYSICADKSGNIYAAGEFTNASSFTYVAKYNGSTWSELGGANGLSGIGSIYTICTDPAGKIYAAGLISYLGDTYVAEYNGTSWGALGGSSLASMLYMPSGGSVESICSDPSGNIYAAGYFENLSHNPFVAKYNGTAWSELGGTNSLAPNSIIYTITSDPAGNMYAAGDFENDSLHRYVAKYGTPEDGIIVFGETVSIKLSPNPTSTSFTISSGQAFSDATIRLLDLTGQVLVEKINQSGSRFTLDISDRATGFYFVEVQQGGETWTGKLVKE